MVFKALVVNGDSWVAEGKLGEGIYLSEFPRLRPDTDTMESIEQEWRENLKFYGSEISPQFIDNLRTCKLAKFEVKLINE